MGSESTNPSAASTTAKMTPMLSQYLEIKKKASDSILLYRMGDFYEMFFEDAIRAAPILDVQLTSRDKKSADPIPMCGVPYRAVEAYIQKLIANGLKVAICEQVGAGGDTHKGIIRREIVRVVTPALISNPDLVSETSVRMLISIVRRHEAYDVALIDLLSGTTQQGTGLDGESLTELVLRHRPQEFLLAEPWSDNHPLTRLLVSMRGIVLTYRESYFECGSALTAAQEYVRETNGDRAVASLHPEGSITLAGHLSIDSVALRTLEILESCSEEIRGSSLFECLDCCLTPMGRRLLKQWLALPSADRTTIENRLDAVGALMANWAIAQSLSSLLGGVRDLERLATKVVLGLAQPADLVAVKEIQQKIPQIVCDLSEVGSHQLNALASAFDPLTQVTEELERALETDPPAAHFRNGGVLRETYRSDIGELRKLSKSSKQLIFELEERERGATDIATLKIRYNRVFGYGFEVTKSHVSRVPARFVRRQTLANGERYVTEELIQLEKKIQFADEELLRLEEELFLELRARLGEWHVLLKKNAQAFAELDVLLNFARVSRERDYCKPEIDAGFTLTIIDGRHPVVERLVPNGTFVPNSVSLDRDSCHTLLITGPNMAGKSTIMRQVALISLMAHMGCFVPARGARVPLLDSIFTRIGSSDNLARGQSTFMVEMNEMARIISNATERSLVLVDEIGRGTSTYDGLSLAWSLLEYLHESVRAKTLFATHFHELTVLEQTLTGLKNVTVLVEKAEDGIVFLHRLVDGACSRSYGVDVAKLAGLPPRILSRAKELLGVFEAQSQRGIRARYKASEFSEKQLGFMDLI